MKGESTRALHGPPPRPVEQASVVPPVHRSTTFVFDSAEHTADVFAGRVPGWSYSRTDNPTATAFADAVAALEDLTGQATGQPFASGSAATASVLMALCDSGSHVVAPQEVYGGTWALLTRQLARFGVRTSFVDATDLAAVRDALRPETTVLWGEVLANPSMTVADLPGLAEVAHAAGIPFVVDATFASPVVCRPIEHGADLVVHSATKYLGGHSDATGGVVVGRPDLVARTRTVRIDLGGALAPDEAYLLLRGLQTLPLRVARQCATALEVATVLAEHPSVLRVDHPGLSTHRDHALATKLFDEGRYGAVVTVTPQGGRDAGLALVDGLHLVTRATSLGGTHSNAVHVATTTHKDMDDASLAAAGIDPGAVRVSIGLEDVADLVADLVGALEAISPR
ncbi:MAG: aminotransferase class I/II-fold pyridoxal phosphate-dependent enzyme [Actinomycetota bacterium]|nr:aminotransferase class I/II-fold pyridoxal phosphate-dependent enzyme [Actinomycetota bacterium]